MLNCKTDQQKLNCIKKLHSIIIDMFSRFDQFITILLNCTVCNKQHDDRPMTSVKHKVQLRDPGFQPVTRAGEQGKAVGSMEEQF